MVAAASQAVKPVADLAAIAAAGEPASGVRLRSDVALAAEGGERGREVGLGPAGNVGEAWRGSRAKSAARAGERGRAAAAAGAWRFRGARSAAGEDRCAGAKRRHACEAAMNGAKDGAADHSRLLDEIRQPRPHLMSGERLARNCGASSPRHAGGPMWPLARRMSGRAWAAGTLATMPARLPSSPAGDQLVEAREFHADDDGLFAGVRELPALDAVERRGERALLRMRPQACL